MPLPRAGTVGYSPHVCCIQHLVRIRSVCVSAPTGFPNLGFYGVECFTCR